MQNLDEILKAAQNVQAELKKAQDNLDSIEVEGAAGGGLVKVRASAKGRIIGLEIEPSLLKPEDKQMLVDLITAAFNDARAKDDQLASEPMSTNHARIPLPPCFKLPFGAGDSRLCGDRGQGRHRENDGRGKR